MENIPMVLSTEDLSRLKYAKGLLENPGFAARLTNIMGIPIKKCFNYLPASWSDSIQNITKKSLHHALDLAIQTIDHAERKSSRDFLHKMMVATSGGIGGAFGLSALAFELPVTTAIMFRSIADIARSEGEDILRLESKLACMEVFALSGNSNKDIPSEVGYYATKAFLSRQISEAAKYAAERGLAEEGAPVIARLISAIASRFGIIVSEKAAATAIPVIGAAGGILVNTIFMNHFQNMAKGHFIIRALERKYDADSVSRLYIDL